MTKKEAQKHINNLTDHKAQRLYEMPWKSTSLVDPKGDELRELANEAKKVLGKHQFQKPFEVLKEIYPDMTREYYDAKRKKEGITTTTKTKKS